MRVVLDETNVQQALKLIEQTPGRARIAVARAMNESTRWGVGQMRRAMAQKTGLPQKTFRTRLRQAKASHKRARLFSMVWAGLNPMLAEDLGLLVRVPGGAALDPTVRNQKGKAYFGGAFIVSQLGSKFFVRTKASSSSQSKLWTEGRKRTPGTENLPIVRPTLDIAPDQSTIDRVSRGVVEEFNKRADRLLRFEIEKAARRAK